MYSLEYRQLKPRQIYIIWLHTADDLLGEHSIVFLCMTNKRKAETFVRACNRKAKVENTLDRHERYSWEKIRCV